MNSHALDGITVLDLGQIYNGPYCSLILSYLGADVTKIEPPDGEPLRSRVDDGEPPEFIMLNSSKKGVTLNLKEDRGQALFKELVADADVVVENFSVGTMERLGLGYDELSEINPELIYAHGSGFGEEGPYSDYPAMDLTIQAMGGVMSCTGFEDSPPVKAGIAVSDFVGGIHLATGVLSALYQREQTGEGQFVEVSMHDAIFPTLTSPLSAQYSDEEMPRRTGNRHNGLGHCPYNVYESANGHIAIFCVTNDHWTSLLKAMGRDELLGDPRFETNYKRTQHMERVDGILQEWTKERTRDSIRETLLDAGVPCGPVKKIEEVADDPHLREREMIVDVDHPEFGEISVFGTPIRLSESDDPDVEPSPTKGGNNEEVFRDELHLSEAEFEQLKRDEII
jgi:crotonobetainyl-CoA:carnitine CoA-transferase CaiB-like acyl-CoA transferase